MGNWGWGHMGGDMGWGFGGIFMILVWVVVIVAIVALARGLFGCPSSSGWPRKKSALDALKERYARGEIGKEEFEQKKRDLK